MAETFQPPASLPEYTTLPKIFLAGSIEMGAAGDWQAALIKTLDDLNVCFLNPRRDEWDQSWKQEIENDQFRNQVEWELSGQEMASTIAMYFAPETKSPITLLELGLFAHSGKMILCCPSGFWRKGNVDIVAKRYGIQTVESLNDLAAELRRRFADNA